MNVKLPLTINNGHGEIIIFKEIIPEPDGDKLLIEGRVEPNCGPVMHVHFKQDENFKVLKGTMMYQTPGGQPIKLTKGETATFLRNNPHKFWNGGNDELIVDSWIKPANNAIFYLTTLYNATKEQKNQKPNAFDGAFLIMKYRSEYDILDMPVFVKKVIIPVTYFVGKILGKYKKFEDAPIAI